MTQQSFNAETTVFSLLNNSNREAQMMNLTRAQLVEVAKHLEVYAGNSKATKETLIAIIAEKMAAMLAQVEATKEQAVTSNQEENAEEIAEENAEEYGFADEQEEEYGCAECNYTAQGCAYCNPNIIPDFCEYEADDQGDQGDQNQPQQIEEAAQVQPEPQPLPETVVVSVGETVQPQLPVNLPDALQSLYRTATDDERSAFDALLANISKPTKASKQPKNDAKQERTVSIEARKKTGCTRLDAAIYWLFAEASEHGYTATEMAARWQEISGEENTEYQIKMFNWYFADFQKGGHNRAAIKGRKVAFRTVEKRNGEEALAVDVDATSSDSLQAYKAQAEKAKDHLAC